MGKPTGFLEINRSLPAKREIRQRLTDYTEVDGAIDNSLSVKQAARCMDCGVPFCHNGCPLGNIIPEFNDAVYQQNWKLAYHILSSTNNFPEFTGRICPAPCETSCVLGINKPPVAIEYIEKTIIEYAFENGLVPTRIPSKRTGKKAAIVGSGPSGLAAADQLNQAGHSVTVFERADEIGGLLRYGIPDFKLDKNVVKRRVNLMALEGVIFKTSCGIGEDISAKELILNFDVIVLCCGSTVPRDLPIPGRHLNGVHFAMSFLPQQNRRVAGKAIDEAAIWASGKHVVVIGGGDTGSDCVGTSNRQGAASVTQLEIMPKPPAERPTSTPWPNWPNILRTSTSHDEGCNRHWDTLTKEFVSDGNGNVKGLRIADVSWKYEPGKPPSFTETVGSEREIPCDLALLAMGFLHPQHTGLLEALEVAYDERGNVKCNNYQTSAEKIFAAGDARRGQSLVVWAISEGREAARAADEYLMGDSILPMKNRGKLAMTTR